MSIRIVEEYLSNDKIVCLDVGAKGGVLQLSKLEKYCTYYGFEPNQTEFIKLEQTDTQYYFSYGLSETGGQKQFFITKHPSYSSLLQSNLESFKKHFGSVKGYSKWPEILQIVKTVEVDTKTLDDFLLEEKITSVDFLKLDTQGTELSLLKGGKQALSKKNVSVIFAEVTLVEVYKNQNLFTDLDHYLKVQGYEFIDCRFYPDLVFNDLFLESKYEKSRFSVGGDAIYAPKLETISSNKLQCFKTGLILSSLRYLSMSSVYLKHCGLTEREIEGIHRFTHKRNLKYLLKGLLPPVVLNLLKKVIRK